MNPGVIEREGGGWFYSLDASHVPGYVRLTLRGLSSPEMSNSLHADLCMLLRLQAGGLYAVLADLRGFRLGSIRTGDLSSLPASLLPPGARLVVIPDAGLMRRPLIVRALLQFAFLRVPDYETAVSLDEALLQLSMDAGRAH